MIDYIIYSEFDNNEGSVVRIEYPNKTGISETVLSSYMIPEGAHNIRSDTFCFIVNKSSDKGDNNIILYSEIKKAIKEFSNRKTTKYLDFSTSSIYKEKLYHQGLAIKKIYSLNTQSQSWANLKATENLFKQNENVFLQLSQDKKEKIFKFIIYTIKDNNPNNIDLIFEIPVHIDIQFQKLKENFVCVYT